jgi:hypothetical protein
MEHHVILGQNQWASLQFERHTVKGTIKENVESESGLNTHTILLVVVVLFRTFIDKKMVVLLVSCKRDEGFSQCLLFYRQARI